ncbi:hypothetical protein C731_4235 [Mycolicibacterium hassiacum DSM 44199]|jgi:hypothetical protein|uniref:Uncharacterized protein n=2 Tax=Mycolicibacterium hassiacum TaxID=46351 RepID=K5BDW7_MYCHD|nr:hypothetical protein C731_4235 [Mycolicibacterium hassiacum DSM 44199]
MPMSFVENGGQVAVVDGHIRTVGVGTLRREWRLLSESELSPGCAQTGAAHAKATASAAAPAAKNLVLIGEPPRCRG